MKIHITSIQSDGREWFTHLSIVEDGGKYYAVHHSVPFTIPQEALTDMVGASGSKSVKLINTHFVPVIVEAMTKFNTSNRKELTCYVEAYAEAKGLARYDLYNARQQ